MPPRTPPRRHPSLLSSPRSPASFHTAPTSPTAVLDYGRLYAQSLLQPTHDLETRNLLTRQTRQIEELKTTLTQEGGSQMRALVAAYRKAASSQYDNVVRELREERASVMGLLVAIAVLVVGLGGIWVFNALTIDPVVVDHYGRYSQVPIEGPGLFGVLLIILLAGIGFFGGRYYQLEKGENRPFVE